MKTVENPDEADVAFVKDEKRYVCFKNRYGILRNTRMTLEMKNQFVQDILKAYPNARFYTGTMELRQCKCGQWGNGNTLDCPVHGSQ